MTQEETYETLKQYANFKIGGSNNYMAKKDGIKITIYTNGRYQVQGKDPNRKKLN